MRSCAVFRIAVLLAVAIMVSSVASAQLLGTAAGSMYYPSSLPSGEMKNSVGVTFVQPPAEVVEEYASALRAPLFEYQIVYGLPANFELEGHVTTIIISNHLSLGARWILPLKPLGFAAGCDLAYWFGRLNINEFDNFVKGWNLYPSLAAGYDFGPFTVTVKGELNFLLSKSQRVGDIVVGDDSNIFNGGAFAIYLEQPLWKDNYCTIGFKSNIVKFYYVVWPAFPTFDHYTFVPEFYFGFRL